MKLLLRVALKKKKNTKETQKQDLWVVQMLRQSTSSVFLAPKVSYWFKSCQAHSSFSPPELLEGKTNCKGCVPYSSGSGPHHRSGSAAAPEDLQDFCGVPACPGDPAAQAFLLSRSLFFSHILIGKDLDFSSSVFGASVRAFDTEKGWSFKCLWHSLWKVIFKKPFYFASWQRYQRNNQCLIWSQQFISIIINRKQWHAALLVIHFPSQQTWRVGMRSNQRYALMFSVWRIGLLAKMLSDASSGGRREGRKAGGNGGSRWKHRAGGSYWKSWVYCGAMAAGYKKISEGRLCYLGVWHQMQPVCEEQQPEWFQCSYFDLYPLRI